MQPFNTDVESFSTVKNYLFFNKYSSLKIGSHKSISDQISLIFWEIQAFGFLIATYSMKQVAISQQVPAWLNSIAESIYRVAKTLLYISYDEIPEPVCTLQLTKLYQFLNSCMYPEPLQIFVSPGRSDCVTRRMLLQEYERAIQSNDEYTSGFTIGDENQQFYVHKEAESSEVDLIYENRAISFVSGMVRELKPFKPDEDNG